MMSNPDMLRQMMDNPMVQSLMSNPDVMRQMITSNPQMRELMEVKRNLCILSHVHTVNVENIYQSSQGVVDL